MFRVFLFSLFLFLIFAQTGCYSQNAQLLKDESQASGPYTYDFGRVKEGEVLKHDFILKNSSSTTLSIKKVDTSCGCTASKVKKDLLLSQESTAIEVSFNTKDYSGPVQQFVYVYTDSLDASAPLGVNGKSNQAIDNSVIRFIIKADVIKN